MPTAVAAARQSYADHPMVRLETAPPGPCHAVSLQETLSGTSTACATVILIGIPPPTMSPQLTIGLGEFVIVVRWMCRSSKPEGKDY